jgi:hypothetical protein
MPERLKGMALAAVPTGAGPAKDSFALGSFSVMPGCGRLADVSRSEGGSLTKCTCRSLADGSVAFANGEMRQWESARSFEEGQPVLGFRLRVLLL